jgi:hypothetical protein
VTRYHPPRLLAAGDDVNEFTCRSSEQTTWLRRHARQSVASTSTRVFVVTPHGSDRVVAYYAWCMGKIYVQAAPERLRTGSAAEVC